MGKIITSRIKRGSLIQHALEDVKRESFDVIKRELREVLKGRAGIYALYRRNTVVKVGLGTDIFYRVRGHARSNKINWDTVSFFIIRNIKYLRDVETAVNRIAKPKYSLQKGRVGDERLFSNTLKNSVNDKNRKLRKEQRKKDNEIKKLQKEISGIKSVMRKSK